MSRRHPGPDCSGLRPGSGRAAAARASRRGRVVSARRARRGAGFTLPEVLIAIALIVLVSGLVVFNWVAMTDTVNHLSPDRVFRAAAREARYQAMLNKTGTYLIYHPEEMAFYVQDRKTEAPLAKFPLELDDTLPGSVEVVFTPLLPLTGMNTAPTRDSEKSKTTLPRLLFHQSGATAPVAVRIAVNGQDMEFELDPFCYGPPPDFVQ